ncbi:MAG: sugar kinase [Eubacteriales bacterium]|nr:sugar kinase [Eubacteriales bacterium]
MKQRENTKYALVVPTSMGVRITPASGQPVAASDTFFMQATSAETNVASICSYLGLPVHVLTAFVKDSPIAAFIKANLRARGMSFEGKEVPQGGPWGYRHQFNIADSGSGVRGPRVCNDRAGEVGKTITAEDFDLDKLFGTDGVGIVHISGLFAALSQNTGELCALIAKKAKENGTLVSFDLNYRATFWKDRETELRKIFSEIASLSDILVGNEEDFQLALGIAGPAAGGKGLAEKTNAFHDMIERVRKEYPGPTVYATTLRQVESANAHLWGAMMLWGDAFYTVSPRKIDVLDRIGGGDGFVGGLLYGILKGWDAEKCLQFAWGSGALATTFLTDYAQPADEEQVFSVWDGNARVKR